MTKIQVPGYIRNSRYFWYVYRCLLKLSQTNTISLEVLDTPPLLDWLIYVTTIYIDGKPLIIDLCDTSILPMTEINARPAGTPILKANYSSILWKNPPISFEHKLPEEQKQFLPLIKPFIFGRAISFDYDVDERELCAKHIKPITKDIVSLSGEGKFLQQTLNRLKIYDLIASSFISNKYELLWNKREHFENRNQVENYEQRIKNYPRPSTSLFNCYENYIEWLSTGRYSLNTPGISASQPFRLVDAVLAQRHVISTKIWIDSVKDYPVIMLPMEGYFNDQNEDETQARRILADLKFYEYSLEAATKWYDANLSVAGMWCQLQKGVA
jgi:hypothetical protein